MNIRTYLLCHRVQIQIPGLVIQAIIWNQVVFNRGPRPAAPAQARPRRACKPRLKA